LVAADLLPTGGSAGSVRARIREWALWTLPAPALAFVLTVVTVAVLATGGLLLSTPLRMESIAVTLLMIGCGAVCVEGTRRLGEPGNPAAKDLMATWLIPVALLVEPVYALLAPLPLVLLTQLRVHRVLTVKRVFTWAALGLAGASAALVHDRLGSAPVPILPVDGTDVLALLAGAAVFFTVNSALVFGVVRAVDPEAPPWPRYVGSDMLTIAAGEVCGAALVVAAYLASPWLVLAAVPPVTLLQRALLYEELRVQARTDAKTGLASVAYWRKLAARALDRAERDREPISVLMIDLDRFKAVNDNHGHLTGDRVLAAVAEVLQATIRPGDIPGRFGGEEFAVVLPGADRHSAVEVGERVRRAVAALDVPSTSVTPRRPVQVSVTVSVGAADNLRSPTTLESLLGAADDALYVAKRAGRNLVRSAADVPR